MTHLDVRLFGPQADAVGERSVRLTLPCESCTCAQVLDALRTAAPPLAESIDSSRLAVNQRLADPADPVRPTDEIALVGMVSGG
ncbi:MAG: MoaD/ThiS family protein [Planctomycetota bacterium]